MNDLVEFLTARLIEDEQAARAAFSGQADPENGWGTERSEGYRHTTITPHVGMIHEAVQADHVVRWNPARVLREVEAKRRIISEYERYVTERRRAMGGWDNSEPSPVITALAAVYADHPDYREEWRP